MFYSNSQIKDILICNICKNRLTDPRLVPCGQTFCYECVRPSDNNIFKCLCEDKRHEIPEKGFPTNLTTVYLLNQKPDQVSRSEKVEKLKFELYKIQIELDNLEKSFKSSEDRIKEYCYTIRNDIDLSAETAVQEIQNQRDELIKKVNQYEHECLANLIKDNSIKRELEKSIEEVKEFYSKWKTKFECHRLDESEVKGALRLCKEYYTKIARFKIKLDKHNFGDKQIKFKNNPSYSEKIGQVELEFFGKFADLSKLSRVKLKPISENIFRDAKIDIAFLNDNKIFICLIDGRFLRLCTHDLDQEQVEVKSHIYVYRAINKSNINSIKCAYSNKNMIVSVTFDDQTHKNTINYLLNENLEEVKQLEIDVLSIDISMNSEYICIFSKENTESYKLNIYDHNLNFVKKYNPKNNETASDITSIQLNDNYIFLFSEKMKVSLIDIKDGSFVRNFNLDGTIFSLYNQKYIIAVNHKSYVLNLYDFEGKKEHSEEIKDALPLIFVKGSQNRILFCDIFKDYIYY